MFSVAPLTPVTTLPGLAGYQVLNDNLEQRVQEYGQRELVKRETEHLKDTLRNVDSAKGLTDDFRAFNSFLASYGLEGFSYGQAMIEKVLEEDVRDPQAISNQLQNPKFKEAAADFQKLMAEQALDEVGANDGGNAPGMPPAPPKEPSAGNEVLDKIEDQFVRRTFEKSVAETAPSVAKALQFKRTAGETEFWYQTIADQNNYEVIRTAYQLPDQFQMQDVDKQKAKLEQIVGDVSVLKDTEKQDEIVQRFMALSQVQGGFGGQSSSAATLLGGGGGGVLSASSGSSLAGNTIASLLSV